MSDFYQRQYLTGAVEAVDPVGLKAKAETSFRSADSMAKTGQTFVDMGRETYLNDIESQAREQLRQAYKEHQTDPEAFKKKAQAIKKGIYASAPMTLPAIRRESEQGLEELFTDYSDKITSNFQQVQTQQYQFSSLKKIDQLQRDISVNMGAAILADGSFNENAIENMSQMFSSIQRTASAVGPDGKPLFSPAQRFGFEKDAMTTAANSALFEALRVSDNPEEFSKKFSSGEIGFDVKVDGEVTRVNLRDYVDKSTAKLVMNEAKRVKKERDTAIKQGNDNFMAEFDYNTELAKTTDDFQNLSDSLERNRERLGEENYFNQKTKLLKKSDDVLGDTNSAYRGQGFASGLASLNPESADDMKDLDNFYKNVYTPSRQGVPYPQRNEELANIISNTKVVPKTLMGEIEAAAYSTDIGALEQTADLMTRIENKNPLLLQRFNERDMAIVNTVKSMRQSGYSAGVINERLTELRKPVTLSVAEGRAKEAEELYPEVDDVLDDVYDSWITIQPEIYDGQRAEMDRVIKEAFKSHYVLTADVGLSKKHAETMVKQQFSPTKVNNRREVMRYAPDNYYSIQDVENDWIREDMIEFSLEQFKGNLYEVPSYLSLILENATKLDFGKGDIYNKYKKSGASDYESKKMQYLADRIVLVPDPIMTPKTAAQGQPVYNLMIKGEDGIFRTILGKGQYWYPDRAKKIKELKQ